MGKPSLRVFIVNTGDLPTLNAHRIEAAYYGTDGDFTTFKDCEGQAVFTVRNDHLVSVERADDSTPIADLRRLMEEADRTGVAAEGEFVGRVVDPDCRTYETVYEVKVNAVQGSVSELAGGRTEVHAAATDPEELMRAMERQSRMASASSRA
ncbi:hypothetical protein [Streptomyces sp. NPDC056188]|uniref:hypothetical protein n=1 Tax=Streptomyces sp. NPDC056188 TaxID=3345740 RepID=UPI0035DC884F